MQVTNLVNEAVNWGAVNVGNCGHATKDVEHPQLSPWRWLELTNGDLCRL